MAITDSRFVTGDHLQWTDTGGEVIVADLKSELIFGMDEVALSIWKGLVEGHNVGEIVESVAIEYDAPRDRIEQDVEKFVQQLVDRGWLTELKTAAIA